MSFGIPVRNGLGVGLLASTSLSTRGGGFSPASLFLAGEQGFIYDPSDFSTLYQDAAGTVPVTAAGQTVGLVLDKSKGLVLGPELVTNGTFDTDTTGWSQIGGGSFAWDASGGIACTDVGGLDCNAQATITTVAGRWYRAQWTVRSAAGGWLFRIRNSADYNYQSISAATGVFTAYFVASVTGNNTVNLISSDTNKTVVFDNISVRELPGNHATQSVLASRPILAREPLGGRRNLLTWTEQFDNAVWGKTAVTANGTEIRETTANSIHVISQVVSLTGTHTFSLELQAVGRDVYTIWMGTSSATFAFIYTFSTNTITSVGTALSNVTATVLSGGWVRFTGNVIAPNRFQVSVGNPGAIYVGDPANGFNIRNAQLETGSTATAYQRVTSVYDVTEAGKADLHYLLFDGSDDFLVTPTITPGTDKVQVFAGVRKLSDAASGLLVESSPFSGSNNGAFGAFAPSSVAPNYLFQSRGTSLRTANPSGFAAPITNVLTGLGDIAADTCILRVNGTQAASSTGDQGTGDYLAYPLYIGRRGGTSFPFNGRLYGLIARFGPNLSDVQIAQTEQWLNQKTGAF